ncbi:ribosome modulation factor [Vibrio cholerae]
MSTVNMEQAIFQKGYEAYFLGASNPYKGSGAKSWEQGWNSAKEDENNALEEEMFAFYEALSHEPKDFDHSCAYTFSK